jgi:hypothetical protein
MEDQPMRKLFIAMGALLGMAVLGGCGGTKDCSSACGKLYDECKFYLIDKATGGQMTKDQGINTCNQNKDKGAIVDCIHNAPCEATKMEQCVQ